MNTGDETTVARLPTARSVLVVCAHPDDESFGLGAVLSVFADRGSELTALCFTHGEASTLHGVAGDLRSVRAAELDAAGAVLRLTRTELLDYPDSRLSGIPVDELAEHVVQEAKAAAADLLLTFDEAGITGHPDHTQATHAARLGAATLDLPILAWAIPASVATQLNREFGTTFIGREPDDLDIRLSVDRARQLDAIACHRSQSADNYVLRRRLELLGDLEHLRYLER